MREEEERCKGEKEKGEEKQKKRTAEGDRNMEERKKKAEIKEEKVYKQ